MQNSSKRVKNKAVRAATQTAYSEHKPKFTDNTSHNQRLKILDWLFKINKRIVRVYEVKGGANE